MTMRLNNRKNDELRPISLEKNIQSNAVASLMIKMGQTHVLCAVTVEESVPPFLLDTGKGWITAEYGMLPCATGSRNKREAVQGRSGRTYEIQRLIGRSLRMMVDIGSLGERTLRVDCDVINADGGTRTAAITGAAIAVNDTLKVLQDRGDLESMPEVVPIAAVSVGLVAGEPLLDLDYSEDSTAQTDANFVMTGDGRIIEVQCTAESAPLERDRFETFFALAGKGIGELLTLWQE